MKRKITSLLLFLILLASLVFGGLYSGGNTTVVRTPEAPPAFSELQDLTPLTKKHYSWWQHSLILGDPVNANEFARICGTLSLTIQWDDVGQALVTATVDILKDHPGSYLGVNYSPYHKDYVYGADATDTTKDAAALALYETRLTALIGYLATANAAFSSDVEIGLVMLDSEIFLVDGGANEAAMVVKYDAFTDATRTLLPAMVPDPNIVWYGRGAYLGDNPAWSSNLHWATSAKSESCTVSMYVPHEPEMNRRRYRETCTVATAEGITNVTPFISLGSGYMRDTAKFQVWTDVLDYPTHCSWMLGAEINNAYYSNYPDRYADYDRAQVVIIFPSPFTHATFTKHFIAYCKGAALDEL